MCDKNRRGEILKLVIPKIAELVFFGLCMLLCSMASRRSVLDVAIDTYSEQQSKVIKTELEKSGGVIDQLKAVATSVQALVKSQKAAQRVSWSLYKRDITKYVHRAKDSNPSNNPTIDNIEKVNIYVTAIPKDELTEIDKRNINWLINVYKPKE